MKKNLDDEIRNKIQSSKTIVELINNGKRPPVELVKIALKDLEQLDRILGRCNSEPIENND
jgi:hypothetical protein